MSEPAPANRDVAAVFERIADLIEIVGEDTRRAAAYRRAAQSVDTFPEPVADLAAAGDLKRIPGIADALSAKIEEILATGSCQALEHLQERVPESLLDLLLVPGVGPKTIHLLYSRLDVSSLEDLRSVAEEGRLRLLPGMGEKKEQNILRELEGLRRRTARTPLALAEPPARALVTRLASLEATVQAAVAGSLRRARETVKDVDLVAASSHPEPVLDAFAGFEEVAEVRARGPTRATVRLQGGLACDLRVVEPEAFAAALQYFTGSQAHNVRLRGRARRAGMKLNEYGLLRETDDGEPERLWTPDEHHLYERLDLPYIPPELREDAGEIEAAERRELPALLRLQDLRGNLHTHSRWSDGRNSVEELHARAREAGYEYLAVTDHSPRVVVANGLGPDRLRRQAEMIRELRERLGEPYLLTGLEVDVLSGGELDMDEEILAELDVVLASVHGRFGMGRSEMTGRILRALESPHVDVLAHPTGRLLGRRDPYDLDLEAVLEAAAATGTVVEINASPERLDLSDRHARRAVERGVRLAVGTDAHSLDGFAAMRYGVQVARRGWVTAGNVINTWSRRRLLEFLRRPKAERRELAVPAGGDES